jgi:hypothetical protein
VKTKEIELVLILVGAVALFVFVPKGIALPFKVLCVFVCLAYWAFTLKPESGSSGNRYQRSLINLRSNPRWSKLIGMVDERTAHRLIQGEMHNNPGRGEDWAIDKVIWDLESDRRGL